MQGTGGGTAGSDTPAAGLEAAPGFKPGGGLETPLEGVVHSAACQHAVDTTQCEVGHSMEHGARDGMGGAERVQHGVPTKGVALLHQGAAVHSSDWTDRYRPLTAVDDHRLSVGAVGASIKAINTPKCLGP